VKILKTFTVIIIFCAAIVALLIVKGQTQSDGLLHELVFLENTEDWEKCELDNCSIDYDSVAVVIGGDNEKSSIATFPVEAGFQFNQLILSWNIRYGVEVSENGSEWYRFGYLSWGDSNIVNVESPKSIEGVGRVGVDVLKLQKPMKYARAVIGCGGAENTDKMFLRRLAFSFSYDNPDWADLKKYHPKVDKPDYGRVNLSVPYITQRSLDANKEGGACSPTSVVMVLNYHIPGIEPDAFAWRAYDRENEIFGNWPYNVQAAYGAGLSKTWVERHCGFDEIYNEVSSGKPVVISIGYDYDQLPNSPIHAAENGHLVTVIGFAGPDSVICNDPAGHGVDDGIVTYPRKELEKAWIEHTAVAYHLWP
jgi:uncharacterized protein YvpB